MTTGAIIATVIMWAIFIGGLSFCLSRLGRGGEWKE